MDLISFVRRNAQGLCQLAEVLGFAVLIEVDRTEGEGVDLVFHPARNIAGKGLDIERFAELTLNEIDLILRQISQLAYQSFLLGFIKLPIRFGGIDHRANDECGLVVGLFRFKVAWEHAVIVRHGGRGVWIDGLDVFGYGTTEQTTQSSFEEIPEATGTAAGRRSRTATEEPTEQVTQTAARGGTFASASQYASE